MKDLQTKQRDARSRNRSTRKLTPQQRLARLDQRGVRARRERRRLRRLIEQEK